MFLWLLVGKTKTNNKTSDSHIKPERKRESKNSNKKHQKLTTSSLKSGIYNSISSSAHPEIPELAYGSGDMAVCCDSGNVSVCGSKAALDVDCLAWHPSALCCLKFLTETDFSLSVRNSGRGFQSTSSIEGRLLEGMESQLKQVLQSQLLNAEDQWVSSAFVPAWNYIPESIYLPCPPTPPHPH